MASIEEALIAKGTGMLSGADLIHIQILCITNATRASAYDDSDQELMRLCGLYNNEYEAGDGATEVREERVERM